MLVPAQLFAESPSKDDVAQPFNRARQMKILRDGDSAPRYRNIRATRTVACRYQRTFCLPAVYLKRALQAEPFIRIEAHYVVRSICTWVS